MKRSLIALMTSLAAISPITALAAPADVSSTSTFTLSVVEATLGITISGSTDAGQVISKTTAGKQTITFPDLQIENSGNTKGVLYTTVLNPTGISFGASEGDLSMVYIQNPSSLNTHPLTSTEEKATNIMSWFDTNGDTAFIAPKEKLTKMDVGFEANGQFPIGNISVPIRWTMKAN